MAPGKSNKNTSGDESVTVPDGSTANSKIGQ